MSHNPIIIALDFEDASQARDLVNTLGDSTDFYKVGLELYAAAGMDFVRELKRQGAEVGHVVLSRTVAALVHDSSIRPQNRSAST